MGYGFPICPLTEDQNLPEIRLFHTYAFRVEVFRPCTSQVAEVRHLTVPISGSSARSCKADLIDYRQRLHKDNDA